MIWVSNIWTLALAFILESLILSAGVYAGNLAIDSMLFNPEIPLTVENIIVSEAVLHSPFCSHLNSLLTWHFISITSLSLRRCKMVDALKGNAHVANTSCSHKLWPFFYFSSAAKNFLMRLNVSRYSKPHFVALYFFDSPTVTSLMKPWAIRKRNSFFVRSTGMLAP